MSDSCKTDKNKLKRLLAASAFAGCMFICNGVYANENVMLPVVLNTNNLSAISGGNCTLIPGTAQNYDYVNKVTNSDGTVSLNYYRVVFNGQTVDNANWVEVSAPGENTIEVKLPDNRTVYLQYQGADGTAEVSSSAVSRAAMAQTLAEPVSVSETSSSRTVLAATPRAAVSYSGRTNSENTTGGTVRGTDDTDEGGYDSDYGYDYGTVTNPRNEHFAVSDSVIVSASASASKSSTYTRELYGGAQNNTGDAGDISGSYTNNTVSVTTKGESVYAGDATATGGTAVLYGPEFTLEINDSYYTTSNYPSDSTLDGRGDSTAIADADADAYANATSTAQGYAYGGGLANSGGGTIGALSADFSGNTAVSRVTGGGAYGGTATAKGGSANAYAGDITINVTYDYVAEPSRHLDAFSYEPEAIAEAYGSSEALAYASAEAYANATTNAQAYANGGALANMADSTIGSISGTYTGNSAIAEALEGTAVAGTANATSGTAYAREGTVNVNATANITLNIPSGYTWEDDYQMYTFQATQSSSSTVYNWVTPDASDEQTSETIYREGPYSWSSDYVISATASTEASTDAYEYDSSYLNETEAKTSNSTAAYARGGAIYNVGTIGDINATFRDNYTKVTADNTRRSYGGALYNNGAIGTIDSTFEDNYAWSLGAAHGSALFNDGSGTIEEIKGTFTGNHSATDSATVEAYGGAIYNSGKITNGITDASFKENRVVGNTARGGAVWTSNTIGVLSGEYTGNYSESSGVASGGAVYTGATITNGITDAQFTQNYAKGANAEGGAILVSGGNAGNIDAVFDRNHTEATGNAYGGAIRNNGTIKDITGEFTGNYSSGATNAYGGAIFTGGTLSKGITGATFTKNYAAGNVAQGGAIHVNSGNAGNINATFDGNYAKGVAGTYGGAIRNNSTIKELRGTFKNNYTDGGAGNSFGGAIYNNGTVTNGIVNAVFENNYVTSTATGAQGGAIWTNKNLTIKADNGITSFTDNYIQNGTTKQDQAIYVNAGRLTLNAVNNGDIIFNDVISGASNFAMTINGNTTGDIYFNIDNAIQGGNVTLSGGNIHITENALAAAGTKINATGNAVMVLNDSQYKTYTINQVASGNTNTDWNIDLNIGTKQSDIIKTNTASSGTIYLNSINVTGEPVEGTSVIQILQTQNNSLKLALNSSLTGQNHIGTQYNSYEDTILADTVWNEIYERLDETVDIYGEYKLATTTTTNDSISYTLTKNVSGEGYTVLGDTMTLWNQLETNDVKNFNFDAAGNTYNLGDNLGVSAGNNLNVNGVASGSSKSTINMNNHTGFVLDAPKTLTLNNVNITGAPNSAGSVINSTNSGTVINLNNVTLSNSNSNAAINNAGTLNVTGGTNTLNSSIAGAGTTNITAGTLNMNASVNQSAVNVNNGSLTMSDSAIINAVLTIASGGNASMQANSITSAVANAGGLTLRGGTLSYDVTGSGTTNITGSVLSNSLIGQAINISTTGALNINASNVGGNVTNANNLTLNGGTLSHTVSGSGTTNVTGNVTSNANIGQNININNAGSLTTNASNVGGNVTNANDLILTGGSLTNTVSGSGMTYVTGDVTSGALIGQDIDISDNASLTSNASNIGGDVTNANDLNLTGGTLSQNVSGNGTTNVTGAVTNTGNIGQNVTISASGELTSNADNIGGTVQNDNSYIITGGTIANNITGSGTSTVDGTVLNNANIGQNVIITEVGSLTSNASSLGGTVSNANDLNLTGGTLNHQVSGTGDTYITNDVLSNAAINQHIDIAADSSLTSSATNIGGNVTNASDLNLTGGTLNHQVSGTGDTYITNDVISNASINQHIDIAADSSLTSSATNIGGNVTNASDLNLTGGTLNHEVTGDGITNVTGSVQNNALIGQDININETGALTSNADNIGGEVTNANSFTLTGGTLVHTVTGDGKTNITGNVLADALIGQLINITGQLTSNADNIGGVVTNSNSLILTGGTLTQNVSGAGATTVTGEVINNAVIGQDVYITETGNLDNNNDIGNVWNEGILTSTAENLTGTIENNKTLNLSGTLDKIVSGSGITYVADSLTFDDGAGINNELNLSGGATLNTTGDENGKYTVGTLTGNGDVLLSTGTLTVNRDAALNDLFITNTGGGRFLEDLTATGNISNENTLNVLGNVSGIEFTNSGTASIGGNAGFTGDVLSSGTLDVTGNLSGVNITNEGTATVSGDVSASGDFSNTNDMTVYGHLSSQDFNNSGTISIYEGAETDNFTNNGKAYITGNLDSNDIINNENSILSVSGHVTGNNMTNYGDVDVTGNVTLQGILNNYSDMDVLGYLIAQEINNTGNLNVEYASNVTVTGDVNSAEDITTSGIITVEGTMTAHDVINDGQLTVEEGANVNGMNNIEGGIVDITGDLVASGVLDGDTGNNSILNDGMLQVSGNVDAEENITNNSIFDVTGSVASSDFTNSDYTSIDGNLNAEGDISNTGLQSSIIVQGNVDGSNLTNEGTVQIGGTLTSDNNIINSNNMTVSGLITSVVTENSGILNAYDGVDIDEFTNTNKVVITGDSNNINLDNSGDMDVDGSVFAENNIDNTGVLTVTGDVNAGADITTGNIFDISGSVSSNNFTNSGDASIEKDLTVTEHINNSDDLTVQGHLSTDTAQNTGILTVRDGMDANSFVNDKTTFVTGDAVIDSLTNNNDMDVAGSVISDSIINNTGDLYVTNDVEGNEITTSNKFEVLGNVTGTNLTASGSASIGGTLDLTNHLNNSGNMTVQGHISGVSGENTGELIANDGVEFESFTNENIANVTGDAIIDSLTNNNDMDISGSLISDTIIQNTGNLDVDENITANIVTNTNTINASGDVSANDFSNDEDGEVKIDKTLTVNNDLINKGNITVDGITTSLNTNNSGTLQLNNGGTLTNLTNDGTINAYNTFVSDNFNNNSLVNISNAAIDINSGINNGEVNVTNSTFNVTGDVIGINSGGVVDVVDSTVNLTGTLQNQKVTVDNSVLNFGTDSDIFKDSALNVNNSRVNTNDGQYNNYNIGELNSSEDSRWAIDIVLNKDEQHADTFTLSEGGSGTIYISTINVGSNVINNCDDNELYILQIIKSAVEDAPQLDYDESKVLSQATAHMTSDIIIASDFGLATTDTKNDSIEIRGWQNTFGAWADLDIIDDKSFTFIPDTNYILSRDVTEIKGNKMDIIGNDITFDINGHEFLNTINEGQNLTISDIIIKNTSGTITNNGTLTYNNVTFTEKDIINNGLFNANGIININNLDNRGSMGMNAVANMNEFVNSGNLLSGKGTINSNLLVNDGYIELDGVINSDELTNNVNGTIYTGDVNVDTITNSGNFNSSGNLVSEEKVYNDGSMSVSGNVVSKEMTNDGTANIRGSLGLDNVTNNKELNIDKNLIIKESITNAGKLFVSGETVSESLVNTGNILIEGDTGITTTIDNSGEMSVEGTASVDKIMNTGSLSFGSPDIVNPDSANNPDTIPEDVYVNNITNDASLTLNNTKLVGVEEITSSDDEKRGNINLRGSYLVSAGNIENQNISAYNNSRIDFTDPYKYVNNNIALNSSTLNLGALTLDSLDLGTVEMTNGTINIASSDVDFHQNTMGKLTIDEYIKHGGDSAIHLNAVNILNVPDMSKRLININFADMSFADQVQYHGRDAVYTPMYMYGASYDYHTGDMVFARGGFYDPDTGKIIGPSNPSDTFSPSVLVSSVSSQVGAKATMDQVMNYSFQHSDNYMAMPSLRRSALLDRNKYAIVDGTPVYKPYEEGNMWFKPYVSFGNIPLHDGPDVSVTTYGSLLGYDSELKEVGNGWSRAFTGYIGYTGASLTYRGISSIQNGGLLGGTVTLYKGNLFNATTVSTGAIVSDVSTPYGNDRPTMLLAGVANKTGYNFEFKDGLFIIQPNFLLSYTFVNTFDYVNASGININSSPLHSITVSPGVRFIANTKNGWQPYIGANFVWNIFDISKVTAESAIAGNAQLPEMSIDPYIQYGIGIQKIFKDNFMAFGQTMIQNGGRTGISISLGMRWVTGYGNDEYLVVPELILDSETLDGQRIIDISDKKKLDKKQNKSKKLKRKQQKNENIVPVQNQNRSSVQYTEGSNEVLINPGMKITPDKKAKIKKKSNKKSVTKAPAKKNAARVSKAKKNAVQNNVIKLNYLNR